MAIQVRDTGLLRDGGAAAGAYQSEPPPRPMGRLAQGVIAVSDRPVPAIPEATLGWLLEADNPAVAVLTRRTLQRLPDDDATLALWDRRNEYAPVAAILEAMRKDGSWDVPSRDYQKYRGSLWQIVLLGELYADGSSPLVRTAAAYAFSRQLPDGSWSCNGKPAASIPCLTANVARGLARLGYERDERIVRALASTVARYRELGVLGCSREGVCFTLNGYCHMLAPKLLMLLGSVPRDVWPEGADELRAACVSALRDKQVFRSLPKGSGEFFDVIYTAKAADRASVREEYLRTHSPLVYGDKPGWLRFGFPLSYNSDALEALAALLAVGEESRPEYGPALTLVRAAADTDSRWTMRNSLNGKMWAHVESKGKPSKWLTLRALQVLAHFGG
jgi:hypothetical protein